MFLPVNELLWATGALTRWVPIGKRPAFLAALNCPSKHPAALAEMMPVCRLRFSFAVDYEVLGYGPGNRTVDWALQTGGRFVLIDAKSRTSDFIQQASTASHNGEMPAPEHDHKCSRVSKASSTPLIRLFSCREPGFQRTSCRIGLKSTMLSPPWIRRKFTSQCSGIGGPISVFWCVARRIANSCWTFLTSRCRTGFSSNHDGSSDPVGFCFELRK